MKAITSLALLPLLLAAGACSSNSKGNSSPNGTPSDSGTSSSEDGASEDGGSGDSGVSGTAYEAVMSGANVVSGNGVPAPVITSAAGDAKLTLESDMMTLDYDITQNVTGVMSVNLHIGAPLEAGNVTHQLTPISQHMKGKVTLSSDEVSALAIDQIYVDVPSQKYPGGEIRGQAVAPMSTIYVAVLTGAQESPVVNSSYTAHASFILSSDGMSALYHVVTNATPTNVLLERAIAPLPGMVEYSLMPTGMTVDGTLTLTGSDPMDFQANHYDVNVQTAQNKTGELRGQVIPAGATLFSAQLLGSNEVPPVTTTATGGAQFVLNADQTMVTYELNVTGIIPQSADWDDGAKGKPGTMLDMLTLGGNGAMGQLMMPANDLSALQGGSNYVNVHTDSDTNGELRGQLTRQ